MKKMMVCSVAAMSLGAGMMVVALKCKKTSGSATKLVNNALNKANNKLNDMC